MAKQKQKRTTVSPSQLANRGAPITLVKVDEKGKQVTTDSGTPITEDLRLRLTNYHLMQIEEEFGGQGDWAQAMLVKPTSAVARVLAIYFEEPVRKAVERIPRGGVGPLVNSVLAAWEVANGTDPTKAVKFLESADAAMRLLTGAPPEEEKEDGSSGAEPGSRSEETSTSSGD